ncbi:MAG TPA: anti-sigma factor [Stellaceae bacterium]|nr:anti-sigma factor [Stellaceae bacterium]
MRYDSPQLREQLAAEYVLGTMPALVRRRFERLLVGDDVLRRTVEAWHLRFDPLDDAATERQPPQRIWNAVERRLALPSPPAAERQGWLASLAFWRGAALAAAALAALAFVYIAVRPAPVPATSVVAILSDDKGNPGWIALAGARGGDIAVAPIRSVAIDAAHAFELWAIAGGKPSPLGLLAPDPGHPLMVQASLVPPGGVLAISVEPPGGSPTGLPTGPVPYKGAVLPPGR